MIPIYIVQVVFLNKTEWFRRRRVWEATRKGHWKRKGGKACFGIHNCFWVQCVYKKDPYLYSTSWWRAGADPYLCINHGLYDHTFEWGREKERLLPTRSEDLCAPIRKEGRGLWAGEYWTAATVADLMWFPDLSRPNLRCWTLFLCECDWKAYDAWLWLLSVCLPYPSNGSNMGLRTLSLVTWQDKVKRLDQHHAWSCCITTVGREFVVEWLVWNTAHRNCCSIWTPR